MFRIDMQDKVAEKGKGGADGRAAPASGSAQGKEGLAAARSSGASAPTAAATAAAAAAAAEPAAAATEPNGMPGGGKKEKKPKKEKAPAAPAVKQPASITALDIRVGKVGACSKCAVYLFAGNGRVAQGHRRPEHVTVAFPLPGSHAVCCGCRL
jgi:hypothetical protein